MDVDKMIISLCIPVHNRTYDLKLTFQSLINAANFSPPVEILVLDYNSKDDLRAYMNVIMRSTLANGVSIRYVPFHGRDYYHMAHARNLATLASSGEYFITMGADIVFKQNTIAIIRENIEREHPAFLYSPKAEGIIICKKDEFVQAGGYDERFEFYSPEDQDLYARLIRRGGKYIVLPRNIFDTIHTPNEVKIKNYRLPLTKRKMLDLMKPIYEENIRNNVLVANPDGWGKWE